MPNYENINICRECRGKCCKRYAGAAIPDDIMQNFDGLLEDAVSAALGSGDWVVDWWEGDPRGLDYDDPKAVSCGYYLRPRCSTDSNRLFIGSWGGICLFLTNTGCRLPLEKRPITCRELEPKADGDCFLHGGGKQKAALAWLDHRTIILALK